MAWGNWEGSVPVLVIRWKDGLWVGTGWQLVYWGR